MREMNDMVSRPGADPRQWISNGTVDTSTDEQKSVTFDPDFGPLVDVKLHPSGAQVRCQVASWCAGNGEGAYFPFVDGDEVVVAVPEGDERAGCVIIGRKNNQIDRFPTTVAGQDVTRNTVSFQRVRCPYVIESAESLMFRTAVTGSFFLMETAGNCTLTDGFKNFVHLGADFIGIQCSGDDGSVKSLLQLDRQDNLITLEVADSGKMTIKADGTASWNMGASIELQAAGMVASEHLVTVEQVANIVAGVLVGLAAMSAPLALAALATPGTASAMVAAGIALAGSPTGASFQLYSVAVQTAINAGLVAKLPNTTGLIPGIGCPGILGG